MRGETKNNERLSSQKLLFSSGPKRVHSGRSETERAGATEKAGGQLSLEAVVGGDMVEDGSVLSVLIHHRAAEPDTANRTVWRENFTSQGSLWLAAGRRTVRYFGISPLHIDGQIRL
jgi:hypothetical protein